MNISSISSSFSFFSFLFIFFALPAFSQPADPTNIRTWGLRDDRTKISWTDNSSNEDEFRIQVSVNGGGFNDLDTVVANENKYFHDGFDTSDSYRYRVRAFRATSPSFSGYTNTASGPVFFDSPRFRMFYNTSNCPPSTGTKTHCTPAGNNPMGDNEYAARIAQILEGSYAEYVTNFGFKIPYNPVSPELSPVNLKYCDGGGCAGGCGMGLAPAYSDPYNHNTNTGDPGSLVVGAHELFHAVQFAYNAVKTDPAGAWVIEAQARAIQDLVCIDAGGLLCQNVDDEPSGVAPYYGQVNSYLGNTNRVLTEASYTAALMWTYLCQEYGTNMAEPQLGLDFLEEFWNEADDDVNRDGIQVIDATLANLGESDRFDDVFKNFVIANYAKQLSGPGVPAKYKYVDESQPPGPYDDVNLHIDQTLGPLEQVGPLVTDVERWGAVYHEIRPDAAVPYISVDYQVDSPHAAFFALLAIKGNDIVAEERATGFSFMKSMANNAYDKVVVIVAGLDNFVNFRFSFNAVNPVVRILDPLSGRKAIAGDVAAPEKFVAKIEVLDPGAQPIEGIPANDFSFQIGPQTVPQANIVTSAYVQGQYWFVIQSPTQTVNGDYDFVANWSILSDTETNAVSYQMRADADNMLIIDKSGSMGSPASKIADAKDAGELYVDSWRVGDQIGVVSFNCDAAPPELTLREWNDTSRDDAQDAITNNISAGGGTSIGNGLDEGLNELIARGDSDHTWAMILLSDGNNTCNDDISDFLDTYEARSDGGDQVPQVHTIAIGADANRPDLENLANKTGGTYHFAAEPGPKGALADSFFLNMAEIYRIVGERVARQQQVLSVRDEAQRVVPDIHPFFVDAGASELVAAIRYEHGQNLDVVLRDPDGNTHQPFKELSDHHIVYRIGAPLPGAWQFEVICDFGNINKGACLGDYLVEASVKSSLTMDLFLPLPLEERKQAIPMPILASLTDTGPITDALVAVTVTDPFGVGTFLFLFDDGNHGDGAAGDGIYGNTYFGTYNPGSYKVDCVSIKLGEFIRRIVEYFVIRNDFDLDQDRMPDCYEKLVGLDPEVNDEFLDPDNDGLINVTECMKGTDPFDPDTDGGGENDGSECENQRNPHEPFDDKFKPPRLTAVPGVSRVFIRYNLPILLASPTIPEISYTYEVSRCIGENGEFQVYDQSINVITDTYQYIDPLVENDKLYKYRFVAIGPNGERSGPSEIVSVTPKMDPYPPFGGILINGGAPTTPSQSAELTLPADDGYDPEYDFLDRDERDPNAETSGLSDMMICNKADCSDGVWEPYMETKEDWPLMPNSCDIATVYAKYRDNAGCESVLYNSAIQIVEAPTATPTSMVRPTPTDTSTPKPTPTNTPRNYDVRPDPLDGHIDARDLMEWLQRLHENGQEMDDLIFDFSRFWKGR